MIITKILALTGVINTFLTSERGKPLYCSKMWPKICGFKVSNWYMKVAHYKYSQTSHIRPPISRHLPLPNENSPTFKRLIYCNKEAATTLVLFDICIDYMYQSYEDYIDKFTDIKVRDKW